MENKKTIGRTAAMVAMAVLIALGASACKKKNKDPIGPAWYDVYGYHCGNGAPKPGCNFYSDGVKIADFEDPYFTGGYTLQYADWFYYDSYGYESYYTGWAWLSTSGILYDDQGYALNESRENGGRDVLADVAELEQNMVQTAAKGLVAKHPALSEAAAMDIASALNDWAKLGKKGGRTEADMKAFTKRLFNVDADAGSNAIDAAMAGDLSKVEAMNAQIAAHWGTDAETSKEILQSWYARQITEAGM
jgi:hypothetical protein